MAGWLADRFAVGRELAADRAATAHSGTAVLAAALLKLAELPACPGAAAVNPRGSLEARISQLEGGGVSGRPRLAPLRLLATLGNGTLLSVAARRVRHRGGLYATLYQRQFRSQPSMPEDARAALIGSWSPLRRSAPTRLPRTPPSHW